MVHHDRLKQLLSQLMEEKSLSVRKLGRQSGIDHATISKIMNGKRKANITHLQKLSDALNVELTIFLEAAGYDTGIKKTSQYPDYFETVRHLIKTTDLHDEELTLEKVNNQIEKYGAYSQTKEGEEMVGGQFQDKLDQSNFSGSSIQTLQKMYTGFLKKRGSVRELTLMGAALLYFIVTTDLLPDYLFPIGFLDDALIVQMISQNLENKRFHTL